MNRCSPARCIALSSVLLMLACKRVPATLPEAEVEPASAAPAVVVEAPTVPPTCVARTPAGAALLIPDMAQWLLHIAPRAVMGSYAYTLFAPQIERNSEWTQLGDLLRPCGFTVGHIDHLYVGFDAAENFVGIVVAPGIGRPEVSRCVIMQIQAAASDPQIADVRPLPGDEGVSMIEFTDGRAYLFGDDMLALATTSWQDAVGDLSSCRGTPAAYGPLATPLRGLDLEAPLWIAAAPPAQTLSSLGLTLGVNMDGMMSLGSSVRFGDGVVLVTRMQLTDPRAASSTAQSLRGIVQAFAGALPPELAAIPNRIAIDAIDADVRLEASLLPQELRFIAGL